MSWAALLSSDWTIRLDDTDFTVALGLVTGYPVYGMASADADGQAAVVLAEARADARKLSLLCGPGGTFYAPVRLDDDGGPPLVSKKGQLLFPFRGAQKVVELPTAEQAMAMAVLGLKLRSREATPLDFLAAADLMEEAEQEELAVYYRRMAA